MNSRRKFIRNSGLLLGSAMLSSSFVEDKIFDATPEKIIKPYRLKPGDTIALCSPAGAVWDQQQVTKFIGILEGFGLKVVKGETLDQKLGYFAGPDELRAAELNKFFGDKKIKGIFSMKGGWGCARLLDKLDYKIIKENPKVLIGFSDITTLLNAIFYKTGLITFHGPVGNSGWNAFTSDHFKKVIMNAEKVLLPSGPPGDNAITTFKKGQATGELIGGNLSVLTGLIGSKYLPDWKGKILFIEEVKEEPYRIDKMLTQLKLNGVFDSIAGLVFGKFPKCTAEEPDKAFTFMEVLEQHTKQLTIPCFFGAAIGHVENKLTVPVGLKATMDAEKGTILLNESAVL